MRGLLIILIIFPCTVFSQVKEVNFLGKSWFLHGYDFRFGGTIFTESYNSELAYFADFPSQDYESNVLYNRVPNGYYNDFVNLYTLGFTFRPFHLSDRVWKRKIEISHDFELSRRNVHHSGHLKIDEKRYINKDYRYTINHLGYSPKITINTPPFLRRFKAYSSIYPTVRIPISGFLYTNPDSSLVPNMQQGYLKNSQLYIDRLPLSYFEYGLGTNIGLKLNLHCKWNLHFERSFQMLFSNSSNSKGTNYGYAFGFRFGLRYLYGVPSEVPKTDQKNDEPKLFW